ncbi:hypothetical protein BDA96_04G044300 [Sorghum bicolor]|nr:hypothetical protein BDA96_04G044300 [Sorghum bicolor]
MMSVMLEYISCTPLVAIATTSAVYHTALASIPNLSYQNKVFPEALFHQLLLAMVHPDHETRVGAHHQRTLSRAVSVFSSSAALFDKLRRNKSSFREYLHDGSMNRILH